MAVFNKESKEVEPDKDHDATLEGEVSHEEASALVDSVAYEDNDEGNSSKDECKEGVGRLILLGANVFFIR